MNNTITVESTVRADVKKVWEYWNAPEYSKQWMHASEDWMCPKAVNDVRVGGHFSYTLAAKDGSTAFDLNGIYTAVEEGKKLEYTLEDGRKVSVNFTETPEGVHIVQIFEMEHVNTEELQRQGWQSTLNNFKAHVEK